MKIELKKIKIRELFKGFVNDQENGVVGYDGKLDIRPKYQREFVYNEKQQKAVIDTIRKGFPLNVMYWVENEDSYEVLDGQQRTLSICSYLDQEFSLTENGVLKYFHSLTKDEQEDILNYELMIYFCKGNEIEKLEWFKTINIAGEKLTDQELRNAVFTGTWLTNAKAYFSKSSCPAAEISEHFLSKKVTRQELLETALKWISNDNIQDYMSKNQHKPNASELWLYFTSLSNWVKTNFPKKRKEMKSVDWGFLYNKFGSQIFDSNQIEKDIKKLMADEDVTKKSGIYFYILTKEDKYLSIRAFTDNQKRETYEKQKGICPQCGKSKKYELEEMEAEHITPWSKGGKTDSKNCQMLCKHHNRKKSDD